MGKGPVMVGRQWQSRRDVSRAIGAGVALAALPATARAVGGTRPATLIPLPDAERRAALAWQVGDAGYRVDEYIVEGLADILESVSMADAVDMSKRDLAADAANRDFRNRVVRADRPYRSRILVYRPRDPGRYSGTTFCEVLHPEEGGKAILWEQLNPSVIARGDAFVSIQPPFSIPGIVALDPARYADLHAEHPTQLWGLIADVARATRRPDGPLSPTASTRQFLCGYSYTGVATADFANYHHAGARDARGRPLIDGYLPMASHSYVRPLGVPVIRVNTQSDFRDRSAVSSDVPDGDAPGHKTRRYELAGCAHIVVPPTAGAVRPPKRLAERGLGLPALDTKRCSAGFPPGSRPNDYPQRAALEAIAAAMIGWVKDGRTPPRAPRIAIGAGGDTRLDRFGNAEGGLRLPTVSAPIATYGMNPSEDVCGLYGYTLDFSPEMKRTLYGDRARYTAAVAATAQRLLAQGFLLDSGVAALVDRARAGADF